VLNYFDRFNHEENEASILFNQTLQYVKDASGNWWRNGGGVSELVAVNIMGK